MDGTRADLTELKARMEELTDLESVTEILYWDQATQMPKAGSPWRGRQMATLGRIAHEK